MSAKSWKPRKPRKPARPRKAVYVPNNTLRALFLERLEAGRITYAEVCLRGEIGRWKDGQFYADTSRVKRELGIVADHPKAPRTQWRIPIEKAVRLARAMDLDPVDVDL